jgi:hypothetical protein
MANSGWSRAVIFISFAGNSAIISGVWEIGIV